MQTMSVEEINAVGGGMMINGSGGGGTSTLNVAAWEHFGEILMAAGALNWETGVGTAAFIAGAVLYEGVTYIEQ